MKHAFRVSVWRVAAGVTLTVVATHAQGTFQNLGFESASIVPINGDLYQRVEFGNALPGWIGYIGGVQQGAALYNRYFMDSSAIGLLDQTPPAHFGLPAGFSSGRFVAVLQAGVAGPNNTPADTTLSQSSLVPISAESLRFRAFAWPYGFVTVLLGGQPLTVVPLASSANYTVYGADIRP